MDEGPDDLWPAEPEAPKRTEPELIVTEQWGLKLPSGQIQWNEWNSIPFHSPIDRLRMVATLQKTALEIGMDEGDQTLDFLAKYSWVTRTQFAKVEYEAADSYSLMAPEVSGAKILDRDDDQRPHELDDPAAHNSPVDVCAGSVGGDAL